MYSSVLSVWSGFVIILWCQMIVGQDGLSGFRDEDVIRGIADELEGRVPYFNTEPRIYPQLRFLNRGTINSITTLAYFESSESNVTVELGLWVPAENDDTVLDDGRSTPLISPFSGLCRSLRYRLLRTVRLSSTRTTRQSGFRKVSQTFTPALVVQAEAIVSMTLIDGILLYQREDDGPPSFPVMWNGRSITCLLEDSSESSDQSPLIHIGIDCEDEDGSCTTGFITQDRLTEIYEEENKVLYSINEISVIPDLYFTRPGRVFAWKFAARALSDDFENNAVPHIQIWRPTERLQFDSDILYERVISTEEHKLNITKEDENLFTYRLQPEVEVEVGDVIGVEQPENSQLFLMFQRGDYANYITDLNSRELQEGDSDDTVLRVPLLRPDFQPSPASESSTHVTQPQSTTKPSLSLTAPAVLISSMPPTLQQASSSPSTGDGVSLPAIVGGVLGAAVVGLAVLVSALLACIVCRRRRKRENRHNHCQPTLTTQPLGDNPVYQAPADNRLAEPFYIDPIRSSELYESIREARMYEVPTTSLSLDKKQPEVNSGHDYHVLDDSRVPKRGSPEEDNDDTDDYQTVNPPPSPPVVSQETVREHDYQELEAPSRLSDEGHSQHTTLQYSRFGGDNELFVPSVEERKTVQKSTAHQHTSSSTDHKIYESLREMQSRSSSVRTQQMRSRSSSVSPVSSLFFEECPSFWQPGSTTDSLYQQLSTRKFREIPRHHIQVTEELGSGRFGTVKRGTWKTSKGEREVAVKMLHPHPTSQDTVMFLQEAAIMGQFRHPNIVELRGMVTVGEPLMIVLELLSNGDLSTYLTKNRAHVVRESHGSEWPGILLGFCQHVAAGMDYLSTKGFVHRDIAARNILLSKDKICKISDFGMSRDLQNENYYITRGGQIPVKWTAPETLNYKKYSTASDVWSFGCLMYEIWSLGHKPFEGYTNAETMELVNSGYRLAPPPGCPRELYYLMIQCWHSTAGLRPSSSEILGALTRPQEESLLQWREEDSQSHHQASILGAELEAGKLLYTELQQTYLQK